MWRLRPANLNLSNYVKTGSLPAAAKFMRKSAAWQGRGTPLGLRCWMPTLPAGLRSVCVAHNPRGPGLGDLFNQFPILS